MCLLRDCKNFADCSFEALVLPLRDAPPPADLASLVPLVVGLHLRGVGLASQIRPWPQNFTHINQPQISASSCGTPRQCRTSCWRSWQSWGRLPPRPGRPRPWPRLPGATLSVKHYWTDKICCVGLYLMMIVGVHQDWEQTWRVDLFYRLFIFSYKSMSITLDS